MVRLCLQQSPALRPTCADILLKIQAIKKTGVSEPEQEKMSLQEEKLLLLKTIKVPRNLGQINAGLPKANYEPGEHKVEEKRLRTRNQSLPPTKDAMS